MRLFSFEKLEVWKASRKLVKNIYTISSIFPNEEKFGLVSQIRRAAVSVSSNIAEGNSRKSFIEQARFTEIAYGSLLEVLSQLILAYDLKFIEKGELEKQRFLIEEISNKLNALKNSQLTRAKKIK